MPDTAGAGRGVHGAARLGGRASGSGRPFVAAVVATMGGWGRVGLLRRGSCLAAVVAAADPAGDHVDRAWIMCSMWIVHARQSLLSYKPLGGGSRSRTQKPPFAVLLAVRLLRGGRGARGARP